MKTDLWKYEIEDVLRVYPDAQLYDAIEDRVHTKAWCLKMNPIPDESELGYILADLDVGTGVAVDQQGKVQHSKLQCKIPMDCHPILLPNIKIMWHTYLVDLIYRPPIKNAIWPRQPKARIISPEISFQTYPNHPHMYVSGNESWACPLSPQDKQWQWGKGATVSYLDQLAIWLLKTAVWMATGAGIAGLGKWIGASTSHDPLSLLQTIRSIDPCWCGSGLCYEKCHMQVDAMRAIRKRIIQSG